MDRQDREIKHVRPGKLAAGRRRIKLPSNKVLTSVFIDPQVVNLVIDRHGEPEAIPKIATRQVPFLRKPRIWWEVGKHYEHIRQQILWKPYVFPDPLPISTFNERLELPYREFRHQVLEKTIVRSPIPLKGGSKYPPRRGIRTTRFEPFERPSAKVNSSTNGSSRMREVGGHVPHGGFRANSEANEAARASG